MSGRWGVGLAAALLMLWFAVPVVPILVWSFADQWRFPAVLPQQWGLRGWALAADEGLVPALMRSLGLGSVVAVLAVALGLGTGRTLARRSSAPGSRWRFLLAVLLLAPVALPPFALAMGLDVLLLRWRVPDAVALVVLLTVFALPYTTYTLRAGFLSLDAELEDQARMLGASRSTAFLRVTLPALAPTVMVATFLAFLIGWSDYIVTAVVTGGQFTTLPVLIGSAASRIGNEPLLGVLSLVSVGVPLTLLLLSGSIMRRTVTRSTAKGGSHAV